jgi:hypothetical protein
MMSAAVVMEGRGILVFQPYNQTLQGFWVAGGPIELVRKRDTNEIASALRRAFLNSKTGAPFNKDRAGPDELLSFLKLKSHIGLMREFRLLSCKLNNGETALMPTRNGGNKAGYVHLREQTVRVPLDSNMLGNAILACIAQSTWQLGSVGIELGKTEAP